MIVVSGEFELNPDRIEDAKAAMAEMMAETHKEEGCIVYQFTQDFQRPHMFRVYEEWETKAHLGAHGQAAHMAEFRGKMGDILVSRKVKMIEAGATKDL